MKLLRLSYRNIWRNKRRSLLDITAIAFNIAMLIFFVCMFRGRTSYIVDRVIDIQTGHYQIHQQHYEDEQQRFPLDLNIKAAKRIQERIRRLPNVTDIARRIEFKGSLSNGIDRMSIIGMGIEPERERNISAISASIITGNYLEAESDSVLIGKMLADILDIKLGDYVFLYGRTQHDVHNLLELQVSGIFQFSFPEMDKHFVFMPLQLTDAFLQMEGAATELIIRKKDASDLDITQNQIARQLQEFPVELKNWRDYSEAMLADLEVDTRIMVILLGVLMIMAIFSILNTVSMALMERTREIGTLRAIGYSKLKVNSILLTELFFLGLVGMIVGSVLGLLIELFMQFHGIPLGDGVTELVNFPIGNTLYGKMGWIEYVFALIVGVGSTFVGGIIPLIKTNKIKIADALRFN